jgi:hypothetical protein
VGRRVTRRTFFEQARLWRRSNFSGQRDRNKRGQLAGYDVSEKDTKAKGEKKKGRRDGVGRTEKEQRGLCECETLRSPSGVVRATMRHKGCPGNPGSDRRRMGLCTDHQMSHDESERCITQGRNWRIRAGRRTGTCGLCRKCPVNSGRWDRLAIESSGGWICMARGMWQLANVAPANSARPSSSPRAFGDHFHHAYEPVSLRLVVFRRSSLRSSRSLVERESDDNSSPFVP